MGWWNMQSNGRWRQNNNSIKFLPHGIHSATAPQELLLLSSLFPVFISDPLRRFNCSLNTEHYSCKIQVLRCDIHFSSNSIWTLGWLHRGKQLALTLLVLASKELPKDQSAVGLAGICCPVGGHSPLIGLSLSRICSSLYT